MSKAVEGDSKKEKVKKTVVLLFSFSLSVSGLFYSNVRNLFDLFGGIC